MSNQAPDIRSRYIGCLLGMAIGDALGVPGAGLSPAEIGARYGTIDGYVARRDEAGEIEVPPAEFSANTELALCLLEALVSSNGLVDPVAAGIRYVQATQRDTAYLLGEIDRRALERADETEEFQDGLSGRGPGSATPAGRVAPVALAHALSDLNPELLTREVLRSVLITHSSPEVVNGALAVAYAIWLIVRREVPPEMLVEEVLSFIDEDDVARSLRAMHRTGFDAADAGDDVSAVVAEAIGHFVRNPDDFAQVVLGAANRGGASNITGAIAGALAGAHLGAEAIPPGLVDGLEGRMYILMSAPALLRTAQMRAGLFFQLHVR